MLLAPPLSVSVFNQRIVSQGQWTPVPVYPLSCITLFLLLGLDLLLLTVRSSSQEMCALYSEPYEGE